MTIPSAKQLIRCFGICLFFAALTPLTADVSESIRIVTGDLEGDYRERMNLAKRLEDRLPSNDVAYLMEFLKKTPEDDPLNSTGFHAVKNEVVGRLLHQQTHPEGVMTLLVEQFRSPDTHEVCSLGGVSP